MNVSCTGKAKIEHNATSVVYEIDASELDWQEVNVESRQMGLETEYQAVVEHPQLGTIIWSVWEYPPGMENHKETDSNGHKIVKDLEYGL